MNNNVSDIIRSLSSLYEVSLQIGQSFDVTENAEAFLKTLMYQQNLSFAGYYKMFRPNTLLKVHAIPKTKVDETEIRLEIVESLKHGSVQIIDGAHQYFSFFNGLSEVAQKEIAIFYAGANSFLVLNKKNEAFNMGELVKYELVFNKFCLFMESLESHHQIKEEVRIKNEQAQIIENNSAQLKEQNVELRNYINSNNELEKFAYRTSHDLKSPLRTLINFSKILKKNSDSNLTENQLGYLDLIMRGGIQMDNLINGILDYSRINALAVNAVEIDLTELLDEVELLLHHNISSSGANIDRVNLPGSIVGDKTKMQQLFLNLLSNALKFRHNNVNPKIAIDFIENDSEYQFSVSDNGIGMSQLESDKIFEVFEKLNPEDRYAGSGIGLSTCKQIVLQHGGRIWVESEKGKGSTFNFTIRKSESAPI